MNEDYKEQLKNTQVKLDRVSPSLCLAKWTQVTINLQNGTCHSCHHTNTHKIPLSELKNNPSALHNTEYKKKQRKLMLNGKRPVECDYCWRVEDSPGDNISDRIYKSNDSWSLPYFDQIINQNHMKDFTPSYVEVNLGHQCNFKCSYCSPSISSKWMSEVEKFGPYPTSNKHGLTPKHLIPIKNDNENPYLDAWWKWWPELYPKLHSFRITGGEPLINKNFYKMLDWIKEHPNENMKFGVNTHLCPPQKLWERFLSLAKEISNKQSTQSFDLYTSCEAWDKKAEYIRYGLDFKLWSQRLRQVLTELPNTKVVIMVTYNALSVTSFKKFLERALEAKKNKSLYHDKRPTPLLIDISYLRNPEHQSIKVLPKEYGKHIKEQLDFMIENQAYRDSNGQPIHGFYQFEIEKMRRLYNWFMSDSDSLDKPRKQTRLQKDFYLFFKEHDKRRQTNFTETFTEMTTFWEHCKELTS